VLKARADVYEAAPHHKVHPSKLHDLVVAAIEAIIDENPDYKQLVDTLLNTLGQTVRRVLKQIGTRDRHAKSTGYFFIQTKRLAESSGKHTGSGCVGCKHDGTQDAVYGGDNLTEDGDPVPPIHRTKRSFPKGHSRSKILGYDYKNGMQPITKQHAMETPEVQEVIDEWGKKQRRRGKQEGWKVGAKKAKKANEEHLAKTSLLDMMGNRRSGRRKAAERMLAFNTPTQAVANRRILRERSGQQRRKDRSGPWGKDVTNADKIVTELAAR
jgi:hypothetical protein